MAPRGLRPQAFFEALMAELEEYLDVLEFDYELPLTTDPLRIDVVVVKKEPDVVIEKQIGRRFRLYNVVEYKSPGDYVSLDDFKKVLVYALLYASTNSVPERDVTITVVSTVYPKDVTKHIQSEWGCIIEEASPGIYVTQLGPMLLQFVESKKLSESDSFWIRNLRGRLSAEDMSAALSASMALKGKTRLGVYIEAIASANPDVVLEVNKKMTNRMRQLLIDMGYAAEWQAAAREAGKLEGLRDGRLEGLRDAAQRMLGIGMSVDDVVRCTGLPREQLS